MGTKIRKGKALFPPYFKRFCRLQSKTGIDCRDSVGTLEGEPIEEGSEEVIVIPIEVPACSLGGGGEIVRGHDHPLSGRGRKFEGGKKFRLLGGKPLRRAHYQIRGCKG